MTSPLPLKEGDKIGIIAPSRKIKPEDLSEFTKFITSWGYQVVFGRNLFSQHNQFGGTDEERADDFKQMISNKEIKAVICGRGGYGTIRILDKLDGLAIKDNPKWIIGFSDFTVMHSYYNKISECESIHSDMPVNFTKESMLNPSWLKLRSLLQGNLVKYDIPAHPLNRSGNAQGMLVGGNLSVLYSLRGTDFDLDTEGRILFIEDLDEYLYHIDRMMMNFKIGGLLKNLRGLVVGYFTNMKDNKIPFGKEAYEIIYDAIKDYSYPVVFNFPAGHDNPNMPLVLGRNITLEVNENSGKIIFL